MDFCNKNILVCGMAQSGISCARLLKKLGANVTIQDLKELEKLNAPSLDKEGITMYLGKNPDEIVEEQDMIIMSPGIPCDLPYLDKTREIGIPIWGEIELSYSLCSCDIAAITGTNGKTTTTAITGEILKLYNKGTNVVGNIGIPFSGKVLNLKPEDYVVAELSSFQLESVHSFKPAISAILNITPDHLNRHKTLENYQAIKERIFMNQDCNDYCILNFDDEVCRDMRNRTAAHIIFFSRLHELEKGVFLKNQTIYAKVFDMDEEIVNIDSLQIFGNHNIENVLAATAIALCAKVPVEIIKTGLIEFEGVEHRMEFVQKLNGIEFYNDSKATNPDSAIKALESLDKPIILIGGGYDKDTDFADWVKCFNGKVKHLIVLGEVADKIIETCKAYSYNCFEKVNSLRNAVDVAFIKAEPGDCIVLSPACASWDMFDDFEQRGKMFKEFVRELR